VIARLTRRSFLVAGGSVLKAAAFVSLARAEPGVVAEIHMKSDQSGATVGFDPVGLLLEPGQTIRWICDANVHTATAYSPRNANHSLRIPEDAKPWDSGFLQPGQSFEVTLTVEGVYDYYCMPHEQAGMVGRLIVGRPGGPGSLGFDYFKAEGKDWTPVPEAARRAFPRVEEIMRERAVRSPLDFSK
jgi:plastocyanin